MSLLTADGVTISATLGTQAVDVVKYLNFTLAPGQVLGLVGESGAGKSMVGRVIAQLLPPGFAVSAGALRFDGEDLVTMARERRRNMLGRDIAFVPQEPLTALNPVRSMGAQFDEHLRRIGIAGVGARRARAIELFEAVHLPRPAALLKSYPHQLSGGMCQRVLIAMAFASRPKLVVADEPTTALDVTTQAHIVKLIAEMQTSYRTALIFITHDLRLAAQICNEIAVLYAGRVVERGPARKVLAEPSHPYTRALQLANPAMTGPRRAIFAIPDQMPGLTALAGIRGCVFQARCPIATTECSARPIATVTVAPDHVAACLHVAKTAAIMPREGVADSAPAATLGPTVLTVEGLSKQFRQNDGLFGRTTIVDAVKDVSFALRAHEFIGIVGESGSGKSTLAKLLLGLERPTAGTIAIGGIDVTAGGAKTRAHRIKGIQMVFQDAQSALNPRRRIFEIVTQTLEAATPEVPRKKRMERAADLLADIGLAPDTATLFQAQLSGGQRQRVNIARALCALPTVLVADEIVSGLDVSVQAQLLELLERLRAEHGFAMLLISHDLSVVRHLCERVMVMHRGRVVETGPTATVFAHPTHPYTRALVEAVPPDDPAARWSALEAKNETAQLPSRRHPV
jgi:peptide/nickel transport system ATP-binding protein